jgi:alkylhydroperoxidase family enzyme
MAWIHTIPEEAARDSLARIYGTARDRAGRIFNILKVQSLNPAVLDASIQQYLAIMFGDSPLTRAQREMLAVVVSRANHCHY